MIDSVKAYPGMKDSGADWLGEVPAHWEVRRIRNLVEMRVSSVDKHLKQGEQPVRLCNYVDVYKNDRIGANLDFMPATATRKEIERFRLIPGDVVLTKDSEVWNDIGVPALVEYSAEDLVCGYHLAILRATAGVLGGEYLFRVLQSAGVAWQFHVASNGVTRFGLSHHAIKSARVPVPPLPEQTAIARFLDAADRRVRRYIWTKERLIELLEEEKQATIHEAVTGRIDVRTGQPYPAYKDSGVEWLGRVPEHWEVAGLGYRYEQCLGKMLDGKRITGEHLVPYLRNIDVQWDEINVADLPQMDIRPDEMPRYTVQPGDLLVCEGGEVGRCAIWRGEIDPCGFQKALHRLRPRDGERDTPRFLYYGLAVAVTSGAFADGHESTIAHLTGEKLRRHRFAFPSTDEQTTIVRYLDATERLSSARRASLLRQIDLLREYRTRLIADVVTGKLDVREAAADLPRTDPLARNRDRADTIPTESKLHPTAHDVVKEAVS